MKKKRIMNITLLIWLNKKIYILYFFCSWFVNEIRTPKFPIAYPCINVINLIKSLSIVSVIDFLRTGKFEKRFEMVTVVPTCNN